MTPTPTSSSDSPSSAELALLLRDELKRQASAGAEVNVEAVLAKWSHIKFSESDLLDLIYQEVVLREEAGARPTIDEYRERFPHLEAPLTRQFALHEVVRDHALEEESAASADPDAEVTFREKYVVIPVPVTGPPLPSLSGYEVLSVLGHGGMGVVYKARQISLNRLVALKMILSGAHAGPQELARFRTEAEVVARLQHPNIVQVYEVGAADQPYLALELVEGSLAKSLAGTPLPARQAAQWMETLARAVHYAHQQGVVHRDLKPANVLLSRNGALKITDFGMAKIVAGQASGQTQSGAILGTPNYMAPEQAEGRTRQIGPATDVFGLGAMLYEFLTGRPPFSGNSVAETLYLVCSTEPVLPSQLQPNLPRDLETICLRCLQKEAERRYSSAEALADDLGAFLAGEPIRSRRAGPWERLTHWARRRPAEALLGATGILSLAGLGVGILWSGALAVSAVASLGLLIGTAWYNAKLQKALREASRQQVLAERSVERMRLLLEMTRRLMQPKQLDDLLMLLAETTVWLANAEFATIYLLDPERGEICSKVTLGPGVGEIRLPLGVGIAGTVAATGQPVNISDAYADPRFNPAIDRRTGHKTRNMLTLPMTARDGRVLGVFQVLNKKDGAFGMEDIEILSALAASAAIAIEQALTACETPGTAPR